MEEERRLEALWHKLQALSKEEEIPREVGSEIVELLLSSPLQPRRVAPMLGRLGPRASLAVPALCEALLRAEEESVLYRILGGLTQIGPASIEALPWILPRLSSSKPSPFLKQRLGEAIGGIGPAAAEALPVLLREFLQEAQRYDAPHLTESVYLPAFWGLGALVVPPFASLLRTGKAHEQAAAAVVFGDFAQHQTPEEELVETLLWGARELANPEHKLRLLFGLGYTRDERALPILRAALEDKRSAYTAARVLPWLGPLGMEAFEAGALASLKIEALRDNFAVGKREAARHPATPLSVLEVFSKDEDERVRAGVAQNPSTPISWLEVFVKDTGPVRAGLARHPKTPVPLLEELSKGIHTEATRGVAEHAKTPLPVLEALSRHSIGYVRAGVAQQPNTPLPVLEALLKDEDPFVRKSLMYNWNTPLSLLEILARDREDEVRGELAKDPHTPLYLLQRFYRDESRFVRSMASQSPNKAVKRQSRGAFSR